MTHKVVYTILAVTALSTAANAHSDNAYDYVRFHAAQKNIDMHSMHNAQNGATGRWLIRSLFGLFDAKTPAQEYEEQIRLQQLQQQKLDKLEEMRVRQIIIDNGAA